MTFKFEYLGEFEFVFENYLGAWSGAQELAFDEKKRMLKISCKCTFNKSPTPSVAAEERLSDT
jgi:hypothetical protein